MALSRDEKVVLAVVAIVGVTAVGLLIYSRTAKAAALPSGQRPGTPPALPPVTPTRARTPVPAPPTQSLTSDQLSRYTRILHGLGYQDAVLGMTVDGVPDEPTRQAILAFQGAYNRERAASHTDWQPASLTVDGVLGPRIAQALEHYVDFLAPG